MVQRSKNTSAIAPADPGSEPFPPDIATRSNAFAVLLLLDLAQLVRTRLSHCRGVRTMVAQPMRNESSEQVGTITFLPSLLYHEESRFSPSLPWPSSPTRPRLPSRPGSHLVFALPARWRGRHRARAATVDEYRRTTPGKTRQARAALVCHLPWWGVSRRGSSRQR